MTPAELSALPDAEVNRMVAEAMGWEWQEIEPGLFMAHDERGVAKLPSEEPDFCRDWSAAGRLWEHMVANDMRPRLSAGPGREVEAGAWSKDHSWVEREDGRPLRALCEAYLLAKGAG